MRTLAIALVISLFCAGASEAQMLGELRGGVFVHNLGNGLLDSGRIADANVEFLFKPLLDTYVAGSLNPHIGVTANFGGAESFGYAGLTYHLPIAVTPFFVEAGLGAALGSDAHYRPGRIRQWRRPRGMGARLGLRCDGPRRRLGRHERRGAGGCHADRRKLSPRFLLRQPIEHHQYRRPRRLQLLSGWSDAVGVRASTGRYAT